MWLVVCANETATQNATQVHRLQRREPGSDVRPHMYAGTIHTLGRGCKEEGARSSHLQHRWRERSIPSDCILSSWRRPACVEEVGQRFDGVHDGLCGGQPAPVPPDHRAPWHRGHNIVVEQPAHKTQCEGTGGWTA